MSILGRYVSPGSPGRFAAARVRDSPGRLGLPLGATTTRAARYGSPAGMKFLHGRAVSDRMPP